MDFFALMEEEEGLDGKLMYERGERDEEGTVVVKAVGKYGGRQKQDVLGKGRLST